MVSAHHPVSASGVCQFLRPNYELLPCGLFITLLVCFTFYDFSAFLFSNFFPCGFRDKQSTEIFCVFMFTVEILMYPTYIAYKRCCSVIQCFYILTFVYLLNTAALTCGIDAYKQAPDK